MNVLVSLVFLCISELAFGHEIDKRFNLFGAGLLHPLTSIESALTFISLGLFAGFLGEVKGGKMMAVASWAVPCGALVAFLLPHLIWSDHLAIGLAITVGLLLVVAPTRFPMWLALIISLVSAAFQGGWNMSELKDAPMFGSILFVTGLSLASATALMVFLELGKRASQPWAKIALRVVGSWIAAAGLMRLVL